MSKSTQVALAVAGGIGAFAFSHYSGLSVEAKLATLAAWAIVAVIGYPLGFLIGHFLSRNSDVDTRGFRVIGWSNLVLWLIPAVGFTVSAMTWLFSRRSADHRASYWWLSSIGGLLALVNAAVGAVENASDRSADRCPFAAQEQWPASDVQTYCQRRG